MRNLSISTKLALVAFVVLLACWNPSCQALDGTSPSSPVHDDPKSHIASVSNNTSLFQKETKTMNREKLTTKIFRKEDFSSDAMGAKVTVIVGVRDYNGRTFPYLVRKLLDLQERSRSALIAPIQIVLTHVGAPENIQHDILAQFSSSITDRFVFIGGEHHSTPTKLGAAFNRGAKVATGDYLLFATDMLDSLSLDNIADLVKVLQHPNVGLVGPKLLDASKGNTAVWSAGLTLLAGKNPHRPSWISWNSDSTGPSYSNKLDVPFLLHRLQGYLPLDSRVQEIRSVLGVSKNCFMVTASHWNQIGGFDTSYDSSYLDMDIALRSAHSFGKMAVYAAHIEVSVAGPDPTSDDSLTGDFVQNEALKNDNKHFLDKWHSSVEEELSYTKNEKLKGVTIVWSMDCGLGQVLGFTTEAVNIIMELQQLARVKVVVDGNCRTEMLKGGFPDVVVKTIDILSKRDDRDATPSYNYGGFNFNSNGDSTNTPHSGQYDKIVAIMHKDPRRYDTSYSYSPPDMLVGRSMYETDSIPADWLDPIQAVDFVWVPSDFNRQSFIRAGVNASKLVVVPETIDLQHFDPQAAVLPPQSAISTPPERLSNPAIFNFLSVFKWEARKAWDTLLQGFFDEFANSTDTSKVHLYIRSNVDAENVNTFESWVQRYLASSGLQPDQLPKVHILDRFVPYYKLPSMYKAAQAFVFPTHGEGWGLPIMEAMAMGLPVICTEWSGLTEFTTSDTAYYLKYSMIDAPQQGHKWARADLADLRRTMRLVYSQPTQAAQVGNRARAHLLDNFHSRIVALDIINKIASQVPNFHSLKSHRPSSFARHNNFFSNPSSSDYRSASTTGYSFGQTGSTTNAATWGLSSTVEKYGQTLVKTKFSD